MLNECLPMGCLSSRSTSVSPEVESGQTRSGRFADNSTRNTTRMDKELANGFRNGADLERPKDNYSDSGTRSQKRAITNIGTSLDNQSEQSDGKEQDDFMTILMDGTNNPNPAGPSKSTGRESKTINRGETFDESFGYSPTGEANETKARRSPGQAKESNATDANQVAVAMPDEKNLDDDSSSFEEELNMNLLRQYIVVDAEISQLENRDALRLYHEKIEQLEQLERELDMISLEAEEVAVRSETDGQNKDSRNDFENNSIISGASGSFSIKSSTARPINESQVNNSSKKAVTSGAASKTTPIKQSKDVEIPMRLDKNERYAFAKENNLSYATIEEVFNRKIILEKERDKLKKDVEMVIIECDRLQQKYKKRDEILDKLFDGRTGNGLENHLEQQLNWLMEQKHYVDQVFYAWKRAETLTSQTCDQFARALELLKRLSKTQDEEHRNELSKSVCNLLIKSRQDMDQAQQYNPNVDAPFFTEAETERFDKIIETMQSSSISQSEYNQMATVVQFAYKRAVSIRLWLEQILQITIARDSFELAEEYKWIAIQLRKERISLINMKLQEQPYRELAQTIREQLIIQQKEQREQQQQQQLEQSKQLAITDGTPATTTRTRQTEINRDSGIESDGIDIEEDIYRLLEMNKSRLEAAVAASRETGFTQAIALDPSGRPLKQAPNPSLAQPSLQPNGTKQAQLSVGGSKTQSKTVNSNKTGQHDQIMRERIQKRVRGEQTLAVGSLAAPAPETENDSDQSLLGPVNVPAVDGATQGAESNESQISKPTEENRTNGGLANFNQRNAAQASAATNLTPTKLRIELDEESRRSLLKQVDQIHSKHRNKLDNLRGNNKAKANDILMRMQSSKQPTK